MLKSRGGNFGNKAVRVTKTAGNTRFGIMAAGSWSNRQQLAIHRQFQLDVINLAAVETIKLFIFNRLQLWAKGTRNTATTPSRHR